MTLNVYAPAISDAIKRSDLRNMRAILRQAKKTRQQQGDLDSAIERLESAITKLSSKKRR